MNNDDSPGNVRGPAVAMTGRPIFSGRPNLVYLCDAGCRPNPGWHLPVVWDGKKFLTSVPVEGTNHRASYQAVKTALEDAGSRQATHIELRLTSDLVYRQLTTGGYCRNVDLEQLRDLTFTLADRITPVRLVLTEEPFALGNVVFKTRARLRDHVLGLSRGSLKPAAS